MTGIATPHDDGGERGRAADRERRRTGPGRARAASPRVALTVTGLVVLACVLPMAWPRGRDSFPLSSYPMFSERRTDSSVRLVVAVASDGDGITVLPTEATGHRQLTQAVRALRDVVDAGGDRPARLCHEIAEWAVHGRPRTSRVGIVTVEYDAIAFLVREHRRPTVLAEHAWCTVAS